MADLKSRMAKVAAPKAEGGNAAPFRSATPAYTHRVTLDLVDEDHRALKLASVEHGRPMAELLRGLVALWRNDPELAARVQELLKH
jgi:hypothetical protein